MNANITKDDLDHATMIENKPNNTESYSLLNVTVYTTPTCTYCHTAKDLLKRNNISFRDIDVSLDPKAAKDLIMKSGQIGVPVLEINDKIIVGFDKDAIVKTLQDYGVNMKEKTLNRDSVSSL
jgi:glutaredoxin-like YruB-family protein